MPVILGIESTCDETAAAVVADGHEVRSNVIATQVEIHAKYRGVVPEIASRAHIENILPVLREALTSGNKNTKGGFETRPCDGRAGFKPAPTEIDAIAVAHRPGLVGSLLIGVTAAKTLAWAMNKPLIGVDHVHAHLYSVVLESNLSPPMPAAGMVCSGGHTAMYRIDSWTDIQLIGSTIDDAVGEAYDKVAAILGLPFPGGPIIDRLAEQGDPKAVKFPRAMLGRESLDFSFSGLKTAVLYHVRGVPGRRQNVGTVFKPALADQEIADIAASFQAACIEVIVKKLRRAIDRISARCVIVGGGVSANRGLRKALAGLEIPVFLPPLQYCTDNAAMTAGLANIFYQQGRFSPLDLDAITYSQFK